ncbi:MAG TPA: DinB family protein [Vicinamibacterales bacterium]|nr:DinB family protein [Vicinamibacterales bacterium]
MNVRQLILAAVLVALPASSLAQNANPLTASAKVQLGAITGFVIRSADKVPEDLYSFKATPDVRSMGQLFGHIADALFGMCATAGGGKPPRTDIEKSVTAKAQLVAALKEGVAYCNTVLDSMTDQKGAEAVPFYFGPTPRLSVLYFATTHTYEHYGNLVTYMRLKNIVPPSSEPAKK